MCVIALLFADQRTLYLVFRDLLEVFSYKDKYLQKEKNTYWICIETKLLIFVVVYSSILIED